MTTRERLEFEFENGLITKREYNLEMRKLRAALKQLTNP